MHMPKVLYICFDIFTSISEYKYVINKHIWKYIINKTDIFVPIHEHLHIHPCSLYTMKFTTVLLDQIMQSCNSPFIRR